MADTMTIASVMTPFPYSIDIKSHANSAKAMLAQLKIRPLPVTEHNLPVAILTDRDIRRAQDLGVDVSIGSDTKIRDIVDLNVYTVAPDESLHTVLMYMHKNQIDVTVIMQDGKLAGIFTSSDICRRYAELIQSLPAEQQSSLDDELKS